ncbi:hypothetical protein LIER_13865 [Lithospermum erythrorhizon]|uniref:Uncharacterized protein n=1 Tax=Lithospermum erythrorhizon TaxID=34254 RepID=A0AAV3PWY4_LITER
MMDKSEPTFVPQWLRSNGSVTGNGTSINALSPPSLHSDDYGTSNVVRKNSSSTSDQNLGRSSASERIKSSCFWRSSSNNGPSNLRTTSSFGRNQRDRGRDDNIYEYSNKDRTILGDFRCRDSSDSLKNNSLSRVERNSLRRSHSMIADQRGETWPRKVETSPKTAYKSKNNNVNPAPDNGHVHKASFEQNFPSLGVEEKLAAFEIRRVPSPGPSLAIHSSQVSASAMRGSGMWTSALAEVPGIVKSNETGVSSAKADALGLPTTASGISTGLSMAETVAQGPPQLQTTPQLSTESQRQELAIKQSRQLIPVTPSLPKALVSNPPEKSKAKIGYPHLILSQRGVAVKPDISKTSNIGKLQVLKPIRERNDSSLQPIDNLNPTCEKAVSSVPDATHSVSASSYVRTQVNNYGHPVAERKHVPPLLEKRPISQSQTQSRNDFFSLMRKKSVPNSSTESFPAISASHKKLGEDEGEGEVATSPVQSEEVPVLANIHVVNSSKDRIMKTSNGYSCNGCESLHSKRNGSLCNSSLFSEEEEAAFLRSLGWEENTEEGGLTDEEISAFYKDLNKYINSKPPCKIQQGMPRFLLALESQIGRVAGISINSSSSKLES